MTLDEFNRHWILRMSGASSADSLVRMVAEARSHEHWNGKLAKHACGILVLLIGPEGSRYRTR